MVSIIRYMFLRIDASQSRLLFCLNYLCTADTYNCSNDGANDIFEYCKNKGAGDIHRLDWNKNNIPCEVFDQQHEFDPITPLAQPTSAPTSSPSGSSQNCGGCCSGHGGVVCVGGITKCSDGTALSSTCRNKGCNMCL